MLSKGDVCKMLEGVGALEHGKYDTALPKEWVDLVSGLGIEVRNSFVWSYREERIFGKPVNICELFVEHFGGTPDIMEEQGE